MSAAANELGMTTEDKQALSKRLAKLFPTLQKMAELQVDIVKIGLDKWSGFNDQKRKALLRQSLEATSDFQEQFGV